MEACDRLGDVPSLFDVGSYLPIAKNMQVLMKLSERLATSRLKQGLDGSEPDLLSFLVRDFLEYWSSNVIKTWFLG